MTLEIRKETKINGDKYYYIYKDNMFVSGTAIYITNPEKDEARANELFDRIKKYGTTDGIEVIKSEEI